MKLGFNQGWTFSRADGTHKGEVSLPHDAMLKEPRVPESAGGENTGWFEGHNYIYRKEFNMDAPGNGKVVFEFEGVYHKAQVFVNNKKLAFHVNGYIGFRVDATQSIKKGKNLIEVLVENSEQPNSRWYSGAGIYRSIWLHKLPEKHILPDSIKITTTSYADREVEFSAETSGTGTVRIEIYDGPDRIYETEKNGAGRYTCKFRLAGTQLWDLDNPRLYQCKVRFEEHEEVIDFGIRMIEWSADRGLCLNGERIILRGACLHHDNGILGACAYDAAEDRKVRLIKESGYNAIRSAHNPCSRAMLEACDRRGVLLIDEYADMWYIHKTKYDYADYIINDYADDLRAIVNKDYNHPCVIGYSIGNEVSETAQKQGIDLCRQMVAVCHKEDSTRFVTCGVNIFFNYLSSLGLGVYSDKKATKDKKAKEQKVGSAFYNNLAGLFGAGFMTWGATLYGSDKKTREAFSEMDVAGYNYGIKRYRKDLKKYPERLILGSETFCKDAYKFWKLAKDNPALIGDFVWTGIDYLGETGLGAWEYKEYAPDFSHGPGWLTAGSGRLDITGRGQGELAYTRVAFELDKLRMAVIPPGYLKKSHSPSAWRMTNAIESWSWNGSSGTETKVEVYARASKVALFLNGKKVGSKRMSGNCRAVFKTKYEDGELKAVAYDAADNIIAEEVLQTAGDETCLTLQPEERNGELLYLRLQYTDTNGMLKPMIRGDIRIKVEGGKLLGLGNGCPYNERGYHTDITDTYYGEALAVIRPENDVVEVYGESSWGNSHISVR